MKFWLLALPAMSNLPNFSIIMERMVDTRGLVYFDANTVFLVIAPAR